MLNLFLIGASSGIGKGLAPLLKEKYNVFEISSSVMDIAKKEQVENYFSDKKIDIVVNLAAYNHDSVVHKIDCHDSTQLQKSIDVNIKGTINLLTTIIPKMRQNGYGRYIYSSSVVVDSPVIGTGIYAACKSFNESLVKTSALESSKYDVTFNSLQLGYFDAGLFHRISDKLQEQIINSIPSRRLGKIVEIYNAINFIVETPYYNGGTLKINGCLSL